MTIPQLEYIIALDTTRHFSKAADMCFVTQPTLSMQIQKLEGELGLEIFDRSRQPVKPTQTGVEIIAKAREALNTLKFIPEIVEATKGQMSGTFRLGIIPTITPALLSRFLRKFVQHYPLVKLEIEDLQTEDMVEALRSDRLDAGIAAVPLKERGIKEEHLYFEPFVAFVPTHHPLENDDFILQAELDINDILLLQQGHCFRNNIINLCGKPRKDTHTLTLHSGNFETLVRLSKKGFGMTLLPYLTALGLNKNDRMRVKPLDDPKPSRQVGLIYSRSQAKKRILEALKETICTSLPKVLTDNDLSHFTSPLGK